MHASASVSMQRRVALVQGHPDPAGARFCHALAEAYAAGVREAGGEIRTIDVANLAFPLLRSREEFERGVVAADIANAQDTLRWCGHLVIVHPLWLGQVPALLKAFLEQTLRPGFAHEVGPRGWRRLLAGRSARIVTTMGMPATMYRLAFGAHGTKALQRSVLGFCGFRPVRSTLIGRVEQCSEYRRVRWLEHLRSLGRDGG